MALAILGALLEVRNQESPSSAYIVIGVVIGSVVGAVLAQRVQMTAMPQMVALLNGFGGLASVLVAWGEMMPAGRRGTRQQCPGGHRRLGIDRRRHLLRQPGGLR